MPEGVTAAAPSGSDQAPPIHLMEVTIEKLVYGGLGLAHSNGQVFLIPFAAPGDRLRVKPIQQKKGFTVAHIEELIHPSPQRQEPCCPYFGTCGGCQLQHLSYSAERLAKIGFIRESLSRIGGIAWPDEIPFHGSPEFNYRLRAQLKIEADGPGIRLGYYEPASHDLCEIDACPLLSPPLNEALGRLRQLPAERLAGHRTIDLVHGDEQAVATHPMVGLSDAVDVSVRVGRLVYRFDPQTFFQVNRFLLEEMLNLVVAEERGGQAIDLYCGVGFFTIPLADRFERVIGVDSDRRAVRRAKENARRNRAGEVQFLALPAGRWLESGGRLPAEVDLIVVDPPRPGLSKNLIRRIVRLGPQWLTYVSCNPTTLARDLKWLLAEGFSLSSVVAIDLFPQTFHIETIAKLRRH